MLKFLEDLDTSVYLSNNYLVLDFETTNLNKGDPNDAGNSLVLGVWRTGKDGRYYYRWGNEYEYGRLLEDIARSDFLFAHNAKFELGWLRRCGIDLGEVLVFDTQIAEFVLLGNKREELNLNACLNRRGFKGKDNYVNICIKGGVNTIDIPPPLLYKYCWVDVDETHKLFLDQRRELVERELLGVLATRCILTPVLVDIEAHGMQLDSEVVYSLYDDLIVQQREVLDDIEEITGGINPNSPKQLGEFLYDTLGFAELKDRRGDPIRTEGGQRSTSAPTIAKLKANNKRQRRFIREATKQAKINGALTKYISKFKDCCDENEGILQFTFNQTIARTHRLTSTGKKYKIQGQNLSREFKPCVRARREDWKIGEIDGAQLEFRVAAYLGQDVVATKDIQEGFDVHANTSEVLTAAGQITSRQNAKEHTFKPLYGGSSGSKAEKTYYAAFKERYPGITSTQESWKYEVLNTKELKTITGLTFYWPDTYMTESGYITNSTSICNYPVQSFATADIIPIAVTYLWHRMRDSKMKSFLTNTIHDSAIAEVHPEEGDQFTELGQQSFVEDVYNYLEKVYNIMFNVPLEAEVTLTENWGKYD